MTEAAAKLRPTLANAAPAEAAARDREKPRAHRPLRAQDFATRSVETSEHMLDAYARLYSDLLSRREKPICVDENSPCASSLPSTPPARSGSGTHRSYASLAKLDIPEFVTVDILPLRS